MSIRAAYSLAGAFGYGGPLSRPQKRSVKAGTSRIASRTPTAAPKKGHIGHTVSPICARGKVREMKKVVPIGGASHDDQHHRDFGGHREAEAQRQQDRMGSTKSGETSSVRRESRLRSSFASASGGQPFDQHTAMKPPAIINPGSAAGRNKAPTETAETTEKGRRNGGRDQDVDHRGSGVVRRAQARRVAQPPLPWISTEPSEALATAEPETPPKTNDSTPRRSPGGCRGRA
ncbi:MAG: hypothetical protein K5Q68_11660 [Roseococcus sp.]|nr:hypothetical protein [Roseococcus sp.]